MGQCEEEANVALTNKQILLCFDVGMCSKCTVTMRMLDITINGAVSSSRNVHDFIVMECISNVKTPCSLVFSRHCVCSLSLLSLY